MSKSAPDRATAAPRAVPADRNPFRVDRLESLAFRPHDVALTAHAVVQRFRDTRWQGAVVGPHGSGKSTLLRRLVAEAHADGHAVLNVFVNRQTPRSARRAELARVVEALAGHAAGSGQASPVVACDGWCHLAPWERRRLLRAARRAEARVLGLAHFCGWGLPVVYRTRATPALLASLVNELQPHADASMVEASTRAAWTASRGNLRDALFGLYDRSAAGV